MHVRFMLGALILNESICHRGGLWWADYDERIDFSDCYDRTSRKAKMKRKNTCVFLLWISAVLFLSPAGTVTGQDTVDLSKASEQPAPQSDLDKLKKEWEEVREQQVKMILEKEAQLEKLKEEVFAKMKTQNVPVVSGGASEPEAQKTSLKDERQKFFAEMNRQKESLRRLQASLDEKAKQLEAERQRFEQEKKTAAH